MLSELLSLADRTNAGAGNEGGAPSDDGGSVNKLRPLEIELNGESSGPIVGRRARGISLDVGFRYQRKRDIQRG